MAQNIVLSWLAGGRIMELKTVQIMDELQIPRPCIDMQTVGYNVEWSQELKLEQSLEEYVKASMLIRILQESGKLAMPKGAGDVIWDMSVGYDLAGIRSERVRAFMEGMKDASAVVERLRAQIPPDLAEFRDLDFATQLSHTLTLSTFHGCPPDEIESIIDFLLTEVGLDCVIKLNPMLLGPATLRGLLNDRLGYTDVRVPDSAFERDMRWDQMVGIVTRLKAKADGLGRTLGVKFTNTLIVENHRDFFPASEKEMYLSGPPLHVLAMSLVRAFRREFGDALPISFSAGIDQKNFADAVAIGLVPVTVCSDLLKPGGYGRAQAYFKELGRRMDAASARDVDAFVLRAYGVAERALEEAGASEEQAARCLEALSTGGERAAAGEELYARWLSASRVLNTEEYVARVVEDARYGWEANRKPPRRLDSHLVLFDCITCDKCIPVCPNDANFAYTLPDDEIPVVKARRDGAGWAIEAGESLRITQKHQIGNFADFCNDCGNCDIFCPELGGPYKVKPRFFGSRASWEEYDGPDGLLVERAGEQTRIEARFAGAGYAVAIAGGRAEYTGDGFEVEFDVADPEGTLKGTAEGVVDLTWFRIMDALARGVADPRVVSYLGLGATA
jgi:putative selenate reductase